MKYIDEVNGDILTEEEMKERLYEYIDHDDILETMQYISFSEIFQHLSEEFRLRLYEETFNRLIEEQFYFSKYDDDDEEDK